jgi:hypothetical protein
MDLILREKRGTGNNDRAEWPCEARLNIWHLEISRGGHHVYNDMLSAVSVIRSQGDIVMILRDPLLERAQLHKAYCTAFRICANFKYYVTNALSVQT